MPTLLAAVYDWLDMLLVTFQCIYGEVYEVDDKKFAELDYLERHPDVYVREQIQINMVSNSKLTWWVIQN